MLIKSLNLMILNHILSFALGHPHHTSREENEEQQHILDITNSAGIGFEEGADAHVYVHGITFPQSTFEDGDTMSLEFRTEEPNALLFHAASRHQGNMEQLTAFVANGEMRVRIKGSCHWLTLSDVAVQSGYNISDGAFHKLTIQVSSAGVAMSMDDRPWRRLHYTSNQFFRCWKVQTIYFGKRNPSAPVSNPSPAELNYPMVGCIRSFNTEKYDYTADPTRHLKASYSKVSSCSYTRSGNSNSNS